MIIQASDELLSPSDPLLFLGLEALADRTIPINSHIAPFELVGYAQGVTPSTTDGRRTVTILWSWVDKDKRSRFIDPGQESYGSDDAYEQEVASHLRYLEEQGAKIESYLCCLRTWHPPASPTKLQGCCAMM